MHEKHFYGVTTLGEKGQAIIPIEARNTMKMKKGEKLLVFGMGFDMLVLSKLSNLEEMASHLSAHLKGVQEIIKKTKKK